MAKLTIIISSLLILMSNIPDYCLGTLAQAKSASNLQNPRLNIISKTAKKVLIDDTETVVTIPPPPSTTLKSLNLKKIDLDLDSDTPARTHWIVQTTAIVCGASVLIILLLILIKFSVTMYKEFRERQIHESSESTTPTVYYQNSSHPSAHIRTPPGHPNIYTVMPGHFVLQPCFTSSNNSNPVSSSNTRRGRNNGARTSGSAIRITGENVHVRPENEFDPPPPYPGIEK